MVIKPTHNAAPNAPNAPQQQADTTKPKANPHRLILQFNPQSWNPNARMQMWAKRRSTPCWNPLKYQCTSVQWQLINWSNNGNPIITTTANSIVEDLGHAEKISITGH